MSFTEFNTEKCEAVIRDIDREEEEHNALLKELECAKNHLRVMKILDNPSVARDKLFQVRVTVFSSMQALLEVFPEKVTSKVIAQQRENFFHIELYVSRSFHAMLHANDWLVDFSLSCSLARKKICKSLNLTGITMNPISVVLPAPICRANDEVVKVNLTTMPITSTSRQIELDTIRTDISYKFASTESDGGGGSSAQEDIINIERMYHPTDDTKQLCGYKLHCPLNRDEFTALLLRNSYPNLRPSRLACNEGNLVARITVNGRRVLLELDTTTVSLRIEAPRDELDQLKTYFTRAFAGKRRKKDFQYLSSSTSLEEARRRLAQSKETDQHERATDMALAAYDAYRRFVDGCPL